MKQIGEIIQESLDLHGQGHPERAFAKACLAFQETIRKKTGKDELALVDYKTFIDEHWELLSFMAFPLINTPYLDQQFVIREISLNPRRSYTIKEIVVHLLTYTLRHGSPPSDMRFLAANKFDVSNGRLFIPSTLITGLLALAVVHPVNADGEIGDRYWISISDFKMFIDELWGRLDLAERIRKFHQTPEWV